MDHTLQDMDEFEMIRNQQEALAHLEQLEALAHLEKLDENFQKESRTHKGGNGLASLVPYGDDDDQVACYYFIAIYLLLKISQTRNQLSKF